MRENSSLSKVITDLLSKSDKERIDFILKDKWIEYTAARAILAELECLYRAPSRQRKKFVLIEGVSGNGKTTLLKRFHSLHPPTRINGNLESPVVYIEGPAGPSVEEFYANILFELGAPIASTVISKKLQLKKLLPMVGAKILLIDNFHDFKYGNTDLKKKFVAAVRKLATDTSVNISIVASGTFIARNVIEGDAQTQSRFSYRLLPRWKKDDELRNLLNTFEKTLPLRRVSNLASESILNRVLIMSDGILANIEEILQESARLAIESGKECIDEEILIAIPYNHKHQPLPVERSEYPLGY